MYPPGNEKTYPTEICNAFQIIILPNIRGIMPSFPGRVTFDVGNVDVDLPW